MRLIDDNKLKDLLSNKDTFLKKKSTLSSLGAEKLYMQMCMSRFLGSILLTLNKTFLSQLHSEFANVRAKALKGIAAFVEEDPTLLLNSDIEYSIKERF